MMASMPSMAVGTGRNTQIRGDSHTCEYQPSYEKIQIQKYRRAASNTAAIPIPAHAPADFGWWAYARSLENTRGATE